MTPAEFLSQIQALEPGRKLGEILAEAFKDYEAKVKAFAPRESKRKVSFGGPGTSPMQMIQAYKDDSNGVD